MHGVLGLAVVTALALEGKSMVSGVVMELGTEERAENGYEDEDVDDVGVGVVQVEHMPRP